MLRSMTLSALSAWASLGKWEKYSVIAGSGLIISAAIMAVDSRLLRHSEYKQWWMDNENQKYAAQVHDLLMPAFKLCGEANYSGVSSAKD